MLAADYEARYLRTWDLLREPMAAFAGRQGTRSSNSGGARPVS